MKIEKNTIQFLEEDNKKEKHEYSKKSWLYFSKYERKENCVGIKKR